MRPTCQKARSALARFGFRPLWADLDKDLVWAEILCAEKTTEPEVSCSASACTTVFARKHSWYVAIQQTAPCDQTHDVLA